jgi:ABC-type sugar transport system substrate-binding protein
MRRTITAVAVLTAAAALAFPSVASAATVPSSDKIFPRDLNLQCTEIGSVPTVYFTPTDGSHRLWLQLSDSVLAATMVRGSTTFTIDGVDQPTQSFDGAPGRANNETHSIDCTFQAGDSSFAIRGSLTLSVPNR